MNITVIWTVAVLAGLGLLLSLVLFLVARRFKVEEDPRIDEIEKVMPGANCGGCGFAGCRAFADAAVKAPNLDNNFCPVGGNEVMKQVAAILGYEIAEKAPQVAVVRCNGSCSNRPVVNEYDGVKSCKVKAALYSGDTLCSFGCLGCGDCAAACQFGGLTMDPRTGLPVVDESLCTGCGGCAKACPKHVIELRPKGPRGMREYVSCVNHDKGPAAKKACAAACIGCGLCAKTCTHDAITIDNFVAYIDPSKCKLCRECEAVCPTGAIHGVNFPKPLDVEAIKSRIAKRKEAAGQPAAKNAPGQAAAPEGPGSLVNGPSVAQPAPVANSASGQPAAKNAPGQAAAPEGPGSLVNGPSVAQPAPVANSASGQPAGSEGPDNRGNGPSAPQAAPAAGDTDSKKEEKI